MFEAPFDGEVRHMLVFGTRPATFFEDLGDTKQNGEVKKRDERSVRCLHACFICTSEED